MYFDPNGDKVFSHSIPPPDGAQNLKPTQTCDEAVTVLQAKVKELESKLIQREVYINFLYFFNYKIHCRLSSLKK